MGKNFYMTVDVSNTSIFSFNFSTLFATWLPGNASTYDVYYGDAGQFYFEVTANSSDLNLLKKYVLNSTVNASLTLVN